ncbi:MAG: SPOR domain-containing protein [Bacteroidia bacterium]
MRKTHLIETHLKQLLYRNNFVVVPGFGAFLCKEIPAKFSSKGYTLIPPSKELVFNPKVTASDGLLAQELVINQKINYSAAENYIDHTVSKWKNDLATKGQFTISEIGLFRLNQSKRIEFRHFAHANFLMSSFGLEIARTQLAISNLIESPQPTKIPQAETKTIVIEKLPVSYQRFKRISIAAILVLSVSATYLYMLSFNPKAIDQAGLNFFQVPIIEDEDLEKLEAAKKEQELVKKVLEESAKSASKAQELQSLDTIISDSTVSAANITEPKESTIAEPTEPAISTEPEVIDKSEKLTENSAESVMYHVIASSVKTEDQVKSEVSRLKIKGFEPVVIKMEGKFRISIGTFATRDSADVFKENIFNDNSIDSWILPK